MSKRSEEASALLRADLIQISANVKRRVAYIKRKTKQYNSKIAECLRDNIITSAHENERLCYAICDAFDKLDNSKVDKKSEAMERVLALRRQFYQAQAHYDRVEQDFTEYVISQGAVLLFENLD